MDSITNSVDTKGKVIKEYYEQLDTSQFDNLDEMDKFLKYKWLKKKYKIKIDLFKRNSDSKVKKNNSIIIKNLPTIITKNPGPSGIADNSGKHWGRKNISLTQIFRI